jgi:hypothetical protein
VGVFIFFHGSIPLTLGFVISFLPYKDDEDATSVCCCFNAVRCWWIIIQYHAPAVAPAINKNILVCVVHTTILLALSEDRGSYKIMRFCNHTSATPFLPILNYEGKKQQP